MRNEKETQENFKILQQDATYILNCQYFTSSIAMTTTTKTLPNDFHECVATSINNIVVYFQKFLPSPLNCWSILKQSLENRLIYDKRRTCFAHAMINWQLWNETIFMHEIAFIYLAEKEIIKSQRAKSGFCLLIYSMQIATG